jgi:hypothetical protein
LCQKLKNLSEALKEFKNVVFTEPHEISTDKARSEPELIKETPKDTPSSA